MPEVTEQGRALPGWPRRLLSRACLMPLASSAAWSSATARTGRWRATFLARLSAAAGPQAWGSRARHARIGRGEAPWDGTENRPRPAADRR